MQVFDYNVKPFVSIIATGTKSPILGAMICTKIKIEEHVLLSTNKGWEDTVNIITMGHKPVSIILSGITSLLNCANNTTGDIMSWYKEGNVHDNPLVRFTLTTKASGEKTNVTYTCVWIGLTQQKNVDWDKTNMNSVLYDASFIGVRI